MSTTHPDPDFTTLMERFQSARSTAEKLLSRVEMAQAMTGAFRLSFGSYKLYALTAAPASYLQWMGKPILKNGETPSLPAKDVAAATLYQAGEALAKSLMKGNSQAKTFYVLEGRQNGYDFTGPVSPRAEDLLDLLCTLYPCTGDEGTEDPDSPDPEDDRFHIWEILPSGHRKMVWRFSGWHYSDDDYAIPQGTLPGQMKPLIDIAHDFY